MFFPEVKIPRPCLWLLRTVEKDLKTAVFEIAAHRQTGSLQHPSNRVF